MVLTPNQAADVRMLRQKVVQYRLNKALGNEYAQQRSAQEVMGWAEIVTDELFPASPEKENA